MGKTMAARIDDRFGAHLTPRNTVRFRVQFDGGAQVFEVSAEALQERFHAKSGDSGDLMEAFFDGQSDIFDAAERKGWQSNVKAVLLEAGAFETGDAP